MDIQELFRIGMDREIKPLLDPPSGLSVGLGESGTKKIGEISLGLPDWRWPRDPLPFEDESVGIFHAYHFFEHLRGEEAIELLKAAERKLVKGGIIQFCIPYYNSNMQAHDLTHKSVWCEDSFSNLFKNDYYDVTAGAYGEPWRLRVHSLCIIGIVERNMCIIGQLVKE